jgi:hypothetical protein
MMLPAEQAGKDGQSFTFCGEEGLYLAPRFRR